LDFGFWIEEKRLLGRRFIYGEKRERRLRGKEIKREPAMGNRREGCFFQVQNSWNQCGIYDLIRGA
jgi:hypothetical protein